MTTEKRLPPPIVRRSDEELGLARMTRSYEVITPLFGGGAEPQEKDAVTVVRGSEVRAQLRFWWRAIRGGRFKGDLAAMKECEDEIWGAPARSDDSPKDNPHIPTVQIALVVTARGTPLEVQARSGKKRGQEVNVGEPESPYSYVAFPLREKRGNVIEGVKFDLHLTCAQRHKPEVDAALWGWETFGGIGARTRRGFGALTCTNVDGARPPSQAAVGEWFNTQAAKFRPIGTWPDGVPSISIGHLQMVPKPFANPMAAWEHLFSALREFRQYRIDKETGKRSPYGRSVWPEPREIRRLAARPGKETNAPDTGKFPRAAFGLPIIFQFKGENIGQFTLKPNSHDRLASPLILRPLQCANGQSVALAVLLVTPNLPPENLPEGSHLDLDGHWVNSRLSAADAAAIPPLNKQTDVMGAFLAWLVRKDR